MIFMSLSQEQIMCSTLCEYTHVAAFSDCHLLKLEISCSASCLTLEIVVLTMNSL